MQESKCEICRRAGQKLFIKGERCFGPKCAILKRNYAPGFQGKRRKSQLSEYGRQLREKQNLKFWYGLREQQFRNYVVESLSKKDKKGNNEDFALNLIKKLETRLDNVVFLLGFASSRKQGRQYVNHGHFSVNGKKIDIPSFAVKKEDRISITPLSLKKPVFKDINSKLKTHKTPSWLSLNVDKLEGQITGDPNMQEANPPAEIQSVLEFYSK